MTTPELANRAAAAAFMQDIKNNPPTHSVQGQAVYSVSRGTTPGIQFSTSLTRLAVKFDTGSSGLDTMPDHITIPYMRIGNPDIHRHLKVGIRKAADDSFQLIGELPIEPLHPLNTGVWLTRANVVGGANDHHMLANDKLSIEYECIDDNNTVALATSETGASGFTSQQYDGSYSNTANALAITIVSKTLVPL